MGKKRRRLSAIVGQPGPLIFRLAACMRPGVQSAIPPLSPCPLPLPFSLHSDAKSFRRVFGLAFRIRRKSFLQALPRFHQLGVEYPLGVPALRTGKGLAWITGSLLVSKKNSRSSIPNRV